MTVTVKLTIEIDIPMYEMYVSAGLTMEGLQSSSLKQMSYENKSLIVLTHPS